MGESTAQRRARRTTQRAESTLQGAESEFNEDPLFQGLRRWASGLQEDPFTYGDDDVDRLQQQSAATIHQGSKDFLDQGLSRIGGTGSGTRGGAAQGLLAETASRFAPALAAQNAQIEQRAMEQRNSDLTNMFNLVTSTLGQQYAFPRDIAQAQLGSGQILGGLAGQPSPLAQGLGGLGGLAGSILGGPAAGRGGLLNKP